MAPEYLNDWLLFTVLFSLLLLVTFIMIKQSNYFYTQDVIVRKFSIMELEVPATPKELHNIVTGLFHLPPAKAKRTLKALRAQLLLDFLFMPLLYGSIFLLCWRVADKMQLTAGKIVFMAFAIAQVIPWICDVAENLFLLSQLKPGVKETSESKHRSFLYMEALKWGLSITAAVCAISAVGYFWCTGEYSEISLRYLGIVVAEIIIFFAAIKFYAKPQ